MNQTTPQERLFASESIWKLLIRIAPPVMLAQLIQALYNIIDSYFVGQFSGDGLTALSVIFPIQLVITAFSVGTGVGVSMAANKLDGIRACCCSDAFSAKYTRLHNDANALCLGGRVVGPGLACELVDLFLDTPFEGGRHAGRVAKISALEQR